MEDQVQGEVQEQKPEEVKIDEASLLIQVNELKDQVQQLASSKNRLLEESKGYKGKYQSLRGEIEDKEREELTSKEKWKELLEKEREDKFKVEKDLKESRQKALLKSVHFEVSKLAPDANDVNDIISALHLTSENFDVEKGEVNGVAQMIDEIRKNKSYLFKQNVPGMNQKVPKYQEPQEKSFEEKSAKERDGELIDLLQQIT